MPSKLFTSGLYFALGVIMLLLKFSWAPKIETAVIVAAFAGSVIFVISHGFHKWVKSESSTALPSEMEDQFIKDSKGS